MLRANSIDGKQILYSYINSHMRPVTTHQTEELNKKEDTAVGKLTYDLMV